MSSNSSCFASVSLLFSIPIMIADDTFMPLVGVGFVVAPNLYLMFHIPKLTLNLASVGQLSDYGNLVTFSCCCCFMQDLQFQKLIGIDHTKGRYMFWMS